MTGMMMVFIKFVFYVFGDLYDVWRGDVRGLVYGNVEFLYFVNAFIVVQSILNIDKSLIVLEKTKEHFELGIWNWIFPDVKVQNIGIQVACKMIADHIETFDCDFTVLQNDFLDSFVLVNHFKDRFACSDWFEIVITHVKTNKLGHATCHLWYNWQLLSVSIFDWL